MTKHRNSTPKPASIRFILNQEFLALLDPSIGTTTQNVKVDNSKMNADNMLRIISKDKSLCPGGNPGTGINDNLDQRVGTIAFKLDEFAQQGVSDQELVRQWITLFDDVDDDEYDGEFREDDEELPMMHVTF